jgi:hypothetical protein
LANVRKEWKAGVRAATRGHDLRHCRGLLMILGAIAMLLLQTPPLAPMHAEERLISWAVDDFRQHLPAQAKAFRAVHFASLIHPEGAARPLLCGEVQVESSATGSSEWIAFATLETRGGYEQWLGGSAVVWCNENTERDLTRDFAERFAQALVPRI